jgi:hypothetical protein
MKEILRRQNSVATPRQVSPASLQHVSAVNFQGALVDESGMIRNQIQTHDKSEIVAVQGSPLRPPNINNSNSMADRDTMPSLVAKLTNKDALCSPGIHLQLTDEFHTQFPL